MNWLARVFLVSLGAHAAEAVGKFISHKICMEIDPVLQTFWDAALRGDAVTVRRMLRQYEIPRNTVHHVYKGHLVLEVAAVRAYSQEKDRALRKVLHVLACARWKLTVTDSRRQNALHILAAQTNGNGGRTGGRIALLAGAERQRTPKMNNMLAGLDSGGKMPEQRTRDWFTAGYLRRTRLSIEQACNAIRAGRR